MKNALFSGVPGLDHSPTYNRWLEMTCPNVLTLTGKWIARLDGCSNLDFCDGYSSYLDQRESTRRVQG